MESRHRALGDGPNKRPKSFMREVRWLQHYTARVDLRATSGPYSSRLEAPCYRLLSRDICSHDFCFTRRTLVRYRREEEENGVAPPEPGSGCGERSLA
ncbi:hypothetical protein EYF80_037623 [Liparis tanakae]|uniref:Uncharacterized protein n=1 Tax=Liparis tanakae TaxID=230148 RepID=A0A4Z2GH37_9TELE|nr:hypothetical protein EYF80_037623 [Liparis tanakae]